MKFTAKQRRFIYQSTVAILVVTIGLGVITPDKVNQAIDQAAQLVGIVAALLAAANVTPDED